MRGRPLPRSFFARDARVLAPELLNKLLVHVDPATEERLVVRLVEVEAYAGSDDPASHAFRGLTPRTETMFGPPGHLYVYFTYGMHWCMNVVAGTRGVASAVLLRAAEPVRGIETMRTRRPKASRDVDLCSGPARLTQALGITGSHDGVDLLRGALRVLDDGVPPPSTPEVSTRIGLAPGVGDDLRWRWSIAGDKFVSRRPSPRKRSRASARLGR
jgi:DNA-3-methyladenine glycosylase